MMQMQLRVCVCVGVGGINVFSVIEQQQHFSIFQLVSPLL